MNKNFPLPDWSDRVLLIAEDQEEKFIVLSALLKKTGIRIFRARNGKEAIRAIDRIPAIEVVLMDVSMPEMDGIEATHWIKKKFPQKVVIAQTAHRHEMIRKRMMEAGCNDYLQKPILQHVLIETLSKYLA